ncbi:protein arginine N-methyltransferase 5 [Trichinella spiralis]|uniref:protein arginine N-methyltransferase 5 n=1 Tax=Trichinella spiralis TaxID=6334 RepID=UPI0001EFE878|nr:protein arginine N-methyltransferase 5 [Trichinella spiralis]
MAFEVGILPIFIQRYASQCLVHISRTVQPGTSGRCLFYSGKHFRSTDAHKVHFWRKILRVSIQTNQQESWPSVTLFQPKKRLPNSAHQTFLTRNLCEIIIISGETKRKRFQCLRC